jgi:hypothetical protein
MNNREVIMHNALPATCLKRDAPRAQTPRFRYHDAMNQRKHSLVIPAILFSCLAAGIGCGKPEAPEVAGAGGVLPLDIPTRLPGVQRLVAIGDLHGDLEATRAALQLANAIDEADRWIGGDLMVVQLGDILDRGDDAMEILDLLEYLGDQARASGGDVHLLNGNHELMNVKLDMRYVSVGGYIDFLPGAERSTDAATAQDVVDGIGKRILAFRPGGAMALRFAERNVITIAGDSVFVHGGVLPHIVDYGIERLNQETRRWMRGDMPCPPEPLLAGDGPVWSRHYSDQPDEEDCRLLEVTLQKLGAKRMVVGHTVQENGISSACNDRVWRIDVGMADHYGGEAAVLDLSHGETRILHQAER